MMKQTKNDAANSSNSPQQPKKSTEHTVFVRFVPPSLLLRRHHMEDHFSQIGPIKKASLIIPKAADDSATAKASSYGFVKYTCESDAVEAAKQLNRSTLTLPPGDQQEGQPQSFQVMVELASLQMKKQQQQQQQQQSNEPEPQQQQPDTTQLSEQQKKHNRVILRNLSFYAKESHVQQVMEQFGQVLEVHIPTVQGKSRGFAFCTFAKSQQAQKAIQKSGAVKIKERPVKVEHSVPKKVHQQQQEQQQKEQRKQEYQQKVKEDLKKLNPGEEKKEEESESDSDSDSDSSDSNQQDEEEDKDKVSKGSDSDSDSDQDSEEEEEADDDSDDEEVDEEELQKPVQEQRELFIRNLPFDATRHDVFEAFRTFGKIQAIYIVTDPTTKLPRGTAFVTYEKQAAAARAMEKAGKQTTGGGLLLKGRPLVIDYAVDRETANTLKKDTNISALKQSKDKRNLYLKTEGRVDEDEVWAQLSESDKLKRQKAWSDKHTKLKSPLFFINPLRLSIRNISKAVDEGALKKLLFDATKRGLEKKLVSVNDMVASWRAQGEMTNREILEQTKQYQSKGSIPDEENPTKVESLDERNMKRTIPSVFLDRDFELAAKRGDKKEAPSRGFAFAEFTHHVQALACLRELNNNVEYSEKFAAGGKAAANALAQKKRSKKKKKKPADGGEDQVVRLPRLIVEFTVENKAKAKQQSERRAHQQAHRQKQKLETKEKRELAAGGGSEEKASKKRGRGARQREKKRQRREGHEEDGSSAVKEAEAKPRKFEKAAKRSREDEEEVERKPKGIKPPKKLNKRQREDRETDEKFSKLVSKYKAEFQDAIGGGKKDKAEPVTVNPKKASLAEGKRWFE